MNDAIRHEQPTVPIFYPPVIRDYPISQRENILRALNHERPLYMPSTGSATQWAPWDGNGDAPPHGQADSQDWFGVKYKYTPEQGSSTPIGGMVPSILEWREKIKWPDYNAWDWRKGGEDFVRDESKALLGQFICGLFETLHLFEGFEQALIDLITEPEKCREFFTRVADHKIEIIKRLNDVYHYDIVTYNDDWGTARAPFFSTDLVEQTLLEQTKRIFDAIKAEGPKMVFHNCGKIDVFVPYMVDEIGADGLEIQSTLNDLKNIVSNYGSKTTVLYFPDPDIVYDPNMTPEDARKFARDVVDTYGAANNPGGGVTFLCTARREDVFYALEEEIYQYSLEKYKRQ